jgi:hypothetical protein
MDCQEIGHPLEMSTKVGRGIDAQFGAKHPKHNLNNEF